MYEEQNETRKFETDELMRMIRQATEIIGNDASAYVRNVNERKKAERKKKRSKRIADFRHSVYRFFHFGKEHPEVISERYREYVIKTLSKEYFDGDNGEENTMNCGRKMILTDEGKFIVGAKIEAI